jgi:hypothetical protein
MSLTIIETGVAPTSASAPSSEVGIIPVWPTIDRDKASAGGNLPLAGRLRYPFGDKGGSADR